MKDNTSHSARRALGTANGTHGSTGRRGVQRGGRR